MVNPYSNMKLRIPKGFQSLLVGLSTEVLRNQPRNIPAFAADYFEKLLQQREQGQFNLTDEHNTNFEEQLSTNPNSHQFDPNSAATKIQAQFRGHLIRRDLDKIIHEHEGPGNSNQTLLDDDQFEKERAAISIQAQFRGYQVRKHLHGIVDDDDEQNPHVTLTSNVSNDEQQQQQMNEENNNKSRIHLQRKSTQLSEDFERHTQIPRDSNFNREFQEKYLNDYISDNNSNHNNNNEDDDDDDMNNSTLDQAATRIQASYRGYKTRKELGTTGHSHSHDHEHYDGTHNKNILSPSNQGNQVLAHDSEDNEAAAVKIQAAYRGYRVRKDLEK